MTHTIAFLDEQLKDLEVEAQKVGYDIDSDEDYKNCCWFVTNAEFQLGEDGIHYPENQSIEVDSFDFYEWFDLVADRIMGEE